MSEVIVSIAAYRHLKDIRTLDGNSRPNGPMLVTHFASFAQPGPKRTDHQPPPHPSSTQATPQSSLQRAVSTTMLRRRRKLTNGGAHSGMVLQPESDRLAQWISAALRAR